MKKLILPVIILIIFAGTFFATSSFLKNHITEYQESLEDATESKNFINVHSFTNMNYEYVESAKIKTKTEKRTEQVGEIEALMSYDLPLVDTVTENINIINSAIEKSCEDYFKNCIAKTKLVSSDDTDEIKYNCKAEVLTNEGSILSIKMVETSSLDEEGFSAFNFSLSTGKQLLLTDVFSMTYAKTSKYIKDKIVEYVDEKYADENKKDEYNTLYAFKRSLDNYDALDFEYYIQNGTVHLFFPEDEFNEYIDAPLIIEIPR